MKNPSAFPIPRGEGGYEYNEGQRGVTLLDYFAGKAMVGLLGRPIVSKEDLCKDAYDYAEAMLKEREKRGGV